MFPLYDCVVQLNGSRENAVFKSQVTAPEIQILRFLHGKSENAADPVINIKPSLDAKKQPVAFKATDQQERARLAGLYSDGETTGVALVNKLFGPVGALPTDVVEAAAEPDEGPGVVSIGTDEIVAVDPNIKRTVIPAPKMEKPKKGPQKPADFLAEAAAASQPQAAAG